MRKPANQCAAKVFTVLDVLWRNFANGYTPGELSKATGLSPSNITHYVNTLEQAGYAERIPATGRISISVSAARKALQVMQSIESEENRLSEIKGRLYTQQ